MLTLDGRDRIVCVAGCDGDSRAALIRLAKFQRACSTSVRVVFLTSKVPHDRTRDGMWFKAWLQHETGLEVSLQDILPCELDQLPSTFDQATGLLTNLLVCPATRDESTEIGGLSILSMWTRAVRRSVPLLVARPEQHGKQLLVVTDGTVQTLSVLALGLELAQRLAMEVSYLDVMRIQDGARTTPATSTTTYAGSIVQAARARRADLIVTALSGADGLAAAELFESAPCSVLGIPRRR